MDASTKLKSLSQENLNKLGINPRHSWAFDRHPVPPSSWKSDNEQLPAPPTESELAAAAANRAEGGGESDGSTSDGQSSTESENGEEAVAAKTAVAGKAKTPVLTDGEYRTSKPLRPVQSKTLPRRASTGIKSKDKSLLIFLTFSANSVQVV